MIKNKPGIILLILLDFKVASLTTNGNLTASYCQILFGIQTKIILVNNLQRERHGIHQNVTKNEYSTNSFHE